MYPDKDKDKLDSLMYTVGKLLVEKAETKVKKFYESRTAESEHGEKNIEVSGYSYANTTITYRNKHNIIYKVLIDYYSQTVEITNKYNNRFDNYELEFFDRLGFQLSSKHTANTGQEVTDWYGKI